MQLKSFLKLVEIQTKVASVTPFLFGVLYTLYRFHTLKPMLLLFFFISMLTFDMFTTALNNYQDWKRAEKKSGYNYENHNAIVKYNLTEKNVIFILLSLFAMAVLFGFLTFLNADIMVLLLGAASFLVGILYSAGPLPLSRTPLGEIFSGFFMGFILPFLAIYISLFNMAPIGFSLDNAILTFSLSLDILLPITLVLVPTMLMIANIMLANNICDREDDIANKRFTLPVYVGTKKAIFIFDLLYYICFFDILLCVVLGYLPLLALIALVPAVKVIQNLKAFHKIQTKKDTFGLSVMNFVLIMFPLILSVLLSWIFNL